MDNRTNLTLFLEVNLLLHVHMQTYMRPFILSLLLNTIFFSDVSLYVCIFLQSIYGDQICAWYRDCCRVDRFFSTFQEIIAIIIL